MQLTNEQLLQLTDPGFNFVDLFLDDGHAGELDFELAAAIAQAQQGAEARSCLFARAAVFAASPTAVAIGGTIGAVGTIGTLGGNR